MPRPRRPRHIRFNPDTTYFKPRGVPLRSLHEITLRADEVEALRLYNLKELSQTESAEQMKISQPTLSRLLTSARNKIADALINSIAQPLKNIGFNFVHNVVIMTDEEKAKFLQMETQGWKG